MYLLMKKLSLSVNESVVETMSFHFRFPGKCPEEDFCHFNFSDVLIWSETKFEEPAIDVNKKSCRRKAVPDVDKLFHRLQLLVLQKKQ